MALTNCVVIDGTGRTPQPGSTVTIDGSRIAEIGLQRDFGPDVRVVDLAGRFVIPGLIDCHAHFAHWGMNLLAYQDRNLMLLAAESAQALRVTLESGCTTARDLGGLDPGFREAVAGRLLPGPRLSCSLAILSPTNGIVDPTTPQGLRSPLVPGIPRAEGDGPYAVRARVRELLRAGADVIKIATTGGISSARIDPRRQVFTREEVETIVDEAHMAGVLVTCHSLGGPGLLLAVRAGVDTIEHGGWLDEETTREMAGRGTWYVPTFSVYHWHATLGPEFKQRRAREMAPHHLRSFQLALDAGVRIAMGTDVGGYGYGDTGLELELLVAAGLTPAKAIEVSTRRSAECLGLEDRLGTLEAGKEADLVVLEADPLEDIGVLRRPEQRVLVMQGGVPVGGTTRYRLLADDAERSR